MNRIIEREITLRPLKQSDAAALFSITSQEKAARYMRFHTHACLQDTTALIQEYEGGPYAFAVVERMSGKFLGYVVMKPGECSETFGLSIFLDPCCWNKGYATFLLGKMVNLAQKDKKIHSLTAHVVGDNFGSRRALEKNGFQIVDRLEFEDLSSCLYVYRLLL